MRLWARAHDLLSRRKAMTTQSRFNTRLVASVFAALFAVAGTAAFAGDSVKAGGPSDKPGRSIEDSAVKARGATEKPGRTADEERKTVKAKNDPSQPGRTADAEKATVKAKHNSGEPGRTVDAGGQKHSN
jgi:hypothetical protein